MTVPPIISVEIRRSNWKIQDVKVEGSLQKPYLKCTCDPLIIVLGVDIQKRYYIYVPNFNLMPLKPGERFEATIDLLLYLFEIMLLLCIDFVRFGWLSVVYVVFPACVFSSHTV